MLLFLMADGISGQSSSAPSRQMPSHSPPHSSHASRDPNFLSAKMRCRPLSVTTKFARSMHFRPNCIVGKFIDMVVLAAFPVALMSPQQTFRSGTARSSLMLKLWPTNFLGSAQRLTNVLSCTAVAASLRHSTHSFCTNWATRTSPFMTTR